ncbi:ribbon-helix-helix protein, CopG family [Caballeronia grimmiae]|uniref:ribbon-helix-helix protein, CopG family n=1 Tax=Caballeronia grimmiae TaxID=1071679 RepID=UPI0038B9F762
MTFGVTSIPIPIMQRTIFSISSELYARLKAFADKSGMPMSEAIRRAVSDFLEKNGG